MDPNGPPQPLDAGTPPPGEERPIPSAQEPPAAPEISPAEPAVPPASPAAAETASPAPAVPAPPAKPGGGPQGERRGPRPPRRERGGPQGGGGPQGERKPGGGGRPPQRQGPPQRQPWSKPDFLAKAVEGGIDKTFLDGALEFARSVGPVVNATHVRAVAGEILRQEMTGFDLERLLLLRPRLAYMAARGGRTEVRELRTVLDRAVEKICAEGLDDDERRARFERFSRGVEAILAYHRFYERKGERA